MTRDEIVTKLRELYATRDKVGRDNSQAAMRGGGSPAAAARLQWLDGAIESFRFELSECDRAPAQATSMLRRGAK